METNRIIEELRAVAALDWNPEQKGYYEQRAADARPVECVRMKDVFTPGQIHFLTIGRGYKTQRKMCYKNAADLVLLISLNPIKFPLPVKYVEGFAYGCGILQIEHAFVKIGNHYIDPTFEMALHRDVRKEMYASLIELDPETMAKYQLETGYYGDLYQYDYLCKNRPELAAQIRAESPQQIKKPPRTVPGVAV